MTDPGPKITKSPLSQKFTSDGITVRVEIYRLEAAQGWTLELIDSDWNSVVWDELFATDDEAMEEFLTGVQDVGLAALLEPDDDDPPMTTIH